MNFKTILTSVVAGASLLSMVGAASAISGNDINIYGASAQYNFWTAEADTFLSGEGCPGAQTSVTTDGKNSITRALCNGNVAPNYTYFRVSSKASYDGPLAIQGNITNPNRGSIGAGSCGDGSAHQRPMMDEAAVTSWGTPAAPTTMPNTAVKCVTVTGGASDVQVQSFSQESHGLLKGPAGGAQTDRNFKGAGAVTSDGLLDCRSLVVPFAFYLNNDVKQNGVVVNNLTLAQARLIFSGQILDWSDLGFDAMPINVCLRHAGSGTHATIDLAIMRPAALILNADLTGPYHYYFNDGSADEMNCLNTLNGSVGYADADQKLTSYPNVHQVTLNGETANKANIMAGTYEFFTVQNLYTANPVPADMATLCTFMSKPANNLNPYYANQCQLTFNKADDSKYLIWQDTTTSCPK